MVGERVNKHMDMICPRCKKVYEDKWIGFPCVDCLVKLIPYSGNMPTCPTCGSIDVTHVTQTRRSLNRWAYGINDPTARAQFECKNCGYKW